MPRAKSDKCINCDNDRAPGRRVCAKCLYQQQAEYRQGKAQAAAEYQTQYRRDNAERLRVYNREYMRAKRAAAKRAVMKAKRPWHEQVAERWK